MDLNRRINWILLIIRESFIVVTSDDIRESASATSRI